MKKFEIFLKNLILHILLLQKPAKRKPHNGSSIHYKILVIRLNRIGDALVTTPLLKELRKYLNTKIFLLADRKNYFVYNNNPDVDEIIIFNKGLKGIFEVLRLIKTEKIDAVVDLHDDVSTTVSYIIALANTPNKYGLEKENKSIYTETIPRPDPKTNHVIVRLLQLAKLFSIEPEIKGANVRFYPSVKAVSKAEEFISNKFFQGFFLIGINISAGSAARFWGVDKYKQLIEYISHYKCKALLLSAPADLHLAEAISENNFPIFSSKNYDEFGAMISKLNLLITPDTAAVHLASAYKIPVFGLYVQYNTDDMIWSPYQSDFEYVLTKEPTLKSITFEEVKLKLGPFLNKYILKEKSN